MTTSSSGFSGSVTNACRMWVVIGSSTPAIAAIVELQPAVALTTCPAPILRPSLSVTPVARPFERSISVTSRVGVDLGAGRVGPAREPPDDRVVADDPAGRVVERAHHRIDRVARHRHRRRQAPDLVRADHPRVDPAAGG